MKVFKCLINIIIALLIVVVAIIVLCKNILSNKILNKNYILSKMEEMQVYLQISRDVKDGFENFIYQSGLPEDTINDLFTDEMIKSDTNSIIDYIYDGTEIKLSDNIVKENLEKKISNYIDSKKLKLNQQGKQNIEEFESLIINEYKTNINYDVNNTLNLYQKIQETIKLLKGFEEKLNYIPIIILVVLIIILIMINHNDLLVVIQFLSISSLSVGILLKMLVDLIYDNFDIDNLMFFSTAMTSLIISIIKEIIFTISDNSKLFVILGIIGIFITALLNGFPVKKDIKNHRLKF